MAADMHMRKFQMRQAPGKVKERLDPIDHALYRIFSLGNRCRDRRFDAIPYRGRGAFNPIKDTGHRALYRIERARYRVARQIVISTNSIFGEAKTTE